MKRSLRRTVWIWLCLISPNVYASQVEIELDPIIIGPPGEITDFSVKESGLGKISSLFESVTLTGVDLQTRSPHNGTQTDFSYRGSNFQGVSVLIDGLPAVDPQTAHFNCDLPLAREDIAEIDVRSGNRQILSGPHSTAGAINFITKKPTAEGKTIELSVGQNKAKSGALSFNTKLNGSTNLRLSANHDESGGFSYDRDFKNDILSASLAGNFNQTDLDARFGFQQKEFGAFDFYSPGAGYPSRESTRTYLLNLAGKTAGEELTLEPAFSYRRHYDKFILDQTMSRSNFISHHCNQQYRPRIYVKKEGTFLGRLGAGAEYSLEKIDSTTLNRHSREFQALFLDQQFDLSEKFSGQISLRLDNTRQTDIYTWSADFQYSMGSNRITGAITRSARIPTFTELYYNDPLTVGDSALSPEKSLNYQLGYDCSKDSFYAGSVLFLRREEGPIDWVKQPNDAKWKSANLDQALFLGSENSLKIKFNRSVTATASYTYVNRYLKDSNYLFKYGVNYSRHLLGTRLNSKFGRLNSGLNLVFKAKPGRSGWVIVDQDFLLEIRKKTAIFLRIENIFDEKYEEIPGIPQPLRNITWGIRADW